MLLWSHDCLKQWARPSCCFLSQKVCVSGHVCASIRSTSQRLFSGKRPEHCDSELFKSGAASVMGSAVGECAFSFLPREHQMESCEKHFSQTLHVWWYRLSKPRASHCHQDCVSLSLLLLPALPGGPQVLPSLHHPIASLLVEEEKQRTEAVSHEALNWAGLGFEPWARAVRLYSSKHLCRPVEHPA